MSLTTDREVELSVEKAAAGGRMIARHEGQVVLVLGAIPGERVLARIDRVEKRLAFATAVRVIEPSPDRRETAADLLCGGCLYAHVAYPRQLALKADVIEDAFTRLGRIPLADRVAVAGSPERGYRMRARLHVHNGRAGFFREGTHQLCDAAPTGQLLPETHDAIAAALREADAEGLDVRSIVVAENMPGDQRAFDFELAGGERAASGDELVADPLAALTAGRAASGDLRRSAASFFQANRFLLPALVAAVLDAVPPEGDVLDLYAGVGLFSVCLAATGRRGVTAVEGDLTACADLRRNAEAFGDAVTVRAGAVEDQVGRQGTPASTVIVDPPRSGISREAMEAIAGHGASRIVYVSCDPPTMARDARRLLDAGYGLESLRGFDLFPATPHVETLGIFQR